MQYLPYIGTALSVLLSLATLYATRRDRSEKHELDKLKIETEHEDHGRETTAAFQIRLIEEGSDVRESVIQLWRTSEKDRKKSEQRERECLGREVVCQGEIRTLKQEMHTLKSGLVTAATGSLPPPPLS